MKLGPSLVVKFLTFVVMLFAFRVFAYKAKMCSKEVLWMRTILYALLAKMRRQHLSEFSVFIQFRSQSNKYFESAILITWLYSIIAGVVVSEYILDVRNFSCCYCFFDISYFITIIIHWSFLYYIQCFIHHNNSKTCILYMPFHFTSQHVLHNAALFKLIYP